MQLITPVLRYKNASSGVDGEAFAVADSRRETFRWGEHLISLVGIETPYPTARRQFSARVIPRDLRLPILWLTGIGRTGDIHVQLSVGADNEWMHGMIATQR